MTMKEWRCERHGTLAYAHAWDSREVCFDKDLRPKRGIKPVSKVERDVPKKKRRKR